MNEPIDKNSLAALLGDALHQADDTVEMAAVIPYIYKHKKIAAFATGEDNPSKGLYRFEFRDHLLTIIAPTQEETDRRNQAFLKLAQGLMMVDKINIVQLKNVQNELSLENARVVRGSVSTADVADKAEIPAPPAAATPAPSAGLSFLRTAGQ